MFNAQSTDSIDQYDERKMMNPELDRVKIYVRLIEETSVLGIHWIVDYISHYPQRTSYCWVYGDKEKAKYSFACLSNQPVDPSW